ncbi:efflux RND transporter permease AcrB [soil metagenome]
MAKFFIDRPIFAWVIAIVIMLAGLLSILRLPISQFPNIAPPAVQINATYPGASASTLENSVTQIIEQQMTGLDGLRYFSSQSSSAGTLQMTLTFENGTNPDIAQVQVQNKLQSALPLLPQQVQQQGVRVTKSRTTFLLVIGFVSTDHKLDRADLSDFLFSNVRDPISRVQGVGDITVFGTQYAMRVWMDPYKLQSFNLTAADIKTALTAQNAQVSSGELGGTPAVGGQQLNATITSATYLQTPEQFANIVLRVNTDGSKVRLGDVARTEIGSENYQIETRFNRDAASGIAIQLATGANALNTANAIRARIEELKPYFPQGVEVVYPYDTTPFVKLSIEEVVKTLVEAIVLVFLVMYLFMQNIRATLIPTIAVPVVLLGTFGIMAAFGYTINTLTMFGLVLAIGLLVDDAIVVVENVERVMVEDKLAPKEATKKSMEQITGALVGIALVLSAVFVPMAFFGGATGVIYRQFSITIVSSMALSVFIALVLTPALCATLLRPVTEHVERKGFFGWFNRSFDKSAHKYRNAVGGLIKRTGRVMLVYAVIVAAMVFLFLRLPSSFLPDEDQGIMFTLITLPSGATQERTLEVVKQVENYYLDNEKDTVSSVFSVLGFSFAGSGQNTALAFVKLKDWGDRKDKQTQIKALAGRAFGAFSQIKDAQVFPFIPPAVLELGNATGFDLQLQDRGSLGHAALMDARNQLLGLASQDKRLTGVRPNGLDDTSQFSVTIDQPKATALGVSISDVNDTITTALGSSYVNDFIDRGRIKRVYVQGDAPFRMLPDDIGKWYVRNAQGQMVPMSAFTSSSWSFGSPRLERFNGISSVNIQGQAAPGISSGTAMDIMQGLVAKLPAGIGLEWNGLSYEERQSGSQAPALYAISILVVFLCLAALYESWAIPFSVLLVIPLGVVGALLATSGRGLSNDVYFQVALLTTIGLSAKNAILIVEFAKDLHDGGMDLVEATLEAVRIRLRPILMTSLAFVFGVMPLAISSGAGSGGQNAIGTGVIGGMVSATALAIFFVPVFFVVVLKFFVERKKRKSGGTTDTTPAGSPAAESHS